MTERIRPLVGVTLDAEQPGGYSKYPWYALRANYAEAITAAGGTPIGLPHDPALAASLLDRIDALVVTGGAFDVDPTLYGAQDRHATVTLKETRTAAELALLRGALAPGHAGAGHLRRGAIADRGAGRHPRAAHSRYDRKPAGTRTA